MKKLISLEAENFKRLKVVRLEPSEKGITFVSGDNEQGKSSVLDAIQAVIGGKRVTPQKPVREGEEKSVLVAELDDIIVKRTFTASGGGSLTVTTSEGSKISSPQEVLNSLFGPLSFDPLEFTNMSPSEQANQVRLAAGLDLTKLEEERDAVFQKRKDAKVVLKERSAIVSNFKTKPEEIDPLDAGEISEQLNTRREWEQKLITMESEQTRRRKEYFEIEEKIKLLEKQKEDSKVDGKRFNSEIKELKENPPTDKDTEILMSELSSLEDHNNKAREWVTYSQAVERKKEQSAIVEVLEKELVNCRKEIDDTIAAAPMPIKNMTLGEDGLLLKGVPFSQASKSERIRAAVEMGIASNPELRLILIRDGSLFDDKKLKLLAELAEEMDIQILVETVGAGKKGVGIIIEDGEVVG